MRVFRALLGIAFVSALVACPRLRPEAPPPGSASLVAGGPLSVAGSAGAVASAEGSATEAGLRVLAAGGGAADGAVAAALVLAVVHPQAGNLGGGGFAVVRVRGEIAALDFRETAPAAARPDMFRGPDGAPIPGASLAGPLAAGVPGSPAGLYELHRRFGRLPWAAVVAPAARLARAGFTVTPRLQAAIESEKAGLSRFPETAAVWLPGGRPRAAGNLVTLPDLATTLEDYAATGPGAITTGRVAAAIEAASRAQGGVLTADDLARYRPVWRDPLIFKAFGWSVASMPLPSSGGIILGETLAMLERTGFPDLPRGGADRAHLLVETWRRAYADRYLLGDPASTRADAAQLLDPAWIARRAAGINLRTATPSADVGPWPGVPAGGAPETTHLSVVDARGDLVALTTTLNGWFGCYLTVPGAGFLLNNEMDDFTTVPGQGNLFGLVQGEANAVRPGARMLSSMTPTIAWRGGDAVALGSPGGPRIPTATVQVLLHLLVDHDSLLDAVLAPRLHHQWRPDEVRAEPEALAPETAAELRERGHEIRSIDHIGEVNAVRLGADGATEAAGDPRGPGAAGALARPLAARRNSRAGS